MWGKGIGKMIKGIEKLEYNSLMNLLRNLVEFIIYGILVTL